MTRSILRVSVEEFEALPWFEKVNLLQEKIDELLAEEERTIALMRRALEALQARNRSQGHQDDAAKAA